MTDSEFSDELVARLNLIIEADVDRSNAVFLTSLERAGYANVGHFLGQIAIPRHISPESSPEGMKTVKFIVPAVEDQKIVKFESLTGEELQARHKAAMAASEAMTKAKDRPETH